MATLSRTIPISYQVRNRSRECGDHGLKTQQIKRSPLFLAATPVTAESIFEPLMHLPCFRSWATERRKPFGSAHADRISGDISLACGEV